MKREIFERDTKIVNNYSIREIRWTKVYIFVHTYNGKMFKINNDSEYTIEDILSIVH